MNKLFSSRSSEERYILGLGFKESLKYKPAMTWDLFFDVFNVFFYPVKFQLFMSFINITGFGV